MDLCSLCQGITLPGLVTPEGYLHHKCFEALQLSAKKCSLCNLLLAATLRDVRPERIGQYFEKNSKASQIELKASDGHSFEPNRLERLSMLVVAVGDIGLVELSLYTDAGDR